MSTRTPTPRLVVGLEKRSRIDGSSYMVGVINEQIAAVFFGPVGKWQPTDAERECAARNRLDGASLRVDPREAS
jgi:hypothetical protein